MSVPVYATYRITSSGYTYLSVYVNGSEITYGHGNEGTSYSTDTGYITIAK